MSNLAELHDSMLKRSTLSDTKIVKDRSRSRLTLSNKSQSISNVFQKSSVEQVIRKIQSDDAMKMQNDLWKVRISKNPNDSNIDVVRKLNDSDLVESAQFFEEDKHSLTLIVKLSDEVDQS